MTDEPEGDAATVAFERLRTSASRAHAIDDRNRVRAFIDGLSHDERLLAGPYLGDPIELTLIRMALRLEQHIESTNHSTINWRTLGATAGATAAGVVAAVAAARESWK